jgi:PIN like domain
VAARFFVDENDLALGKALAARFGDVVYAGHPDLPDVPLGSVDDVWLPVVGRLRLAVITRDAQIRYRPVEKQAWIDHAIVGFILTGTRSQSTDASMAILVRSWRRIEHVLASLPAGPRMYTVTDRRLLEVKLRSS